MGARSAADRPSGRWGVGAARVADGRYCQPAVEPDASGESLVKPVRAPAATPAGRHAGAGPRPPPPAARPVLPHPVRTPAERTRSGTASRCGCGGSPSSAPAPHPAAPGPPRVVPEQGPGCLAPPRTTQLARRDRTARQGPGLAQVAEGGLVAPHGRLHQAPGNGGRGRPVRLVLATELL